MYCISISYKTADLKLRKRLAFSRQTQSRLLSELVGCESISQCVLLCTCNRTEVYFCGSKGSENEVIKSLAHYADIADDYLLRYAMVFCGDNALVHLFRVAAGVDSMVLGEDEILGQTKEAYSFAQENKAVFYELNMIFQSAIACAKKIKTDTAISKTSVSIATLAANEAAKFKDKVEVLVIGASGKTGTTVLKNLISHKNVSVTATLRKHNAELSFVKNLNISTADYADRYKLLSSADCVISVTSSPHYTVTMYDISQNSLKEKPRLFIDLAVPPDIDPQIVSLKQSRLVNIDYFEQLARENNALKMDSVEQAHSIIDREIDELKKDLAFHSFLPLPEDIKSGLSQNNVEKLIYRMKSEATAEEFAKFLDILGSLGGK